jgi:hypothetical protein
MRGRYSLSEDNLKGYVGLPDGIATREEPLAAAARSLPLGALQVSPRALPP